MKGVKKRRIPLPWFIVFALLFVFVFVAVMILTQNLLVYNTISSMMGDRRLVLVSGDPDKYIRYQSDYENKEDVYAAANKLNERICEEGIVLLKNEDNALPLKAEERNVTVFGKNSADIVLGGTGSNAGSSGGEKTDFSVVLESDGRFRTNPVMRSYLSGNASGTGRPNAPGMGVTLSGFPTGEAPLPYPDDVKASYNDYNDAAIVVISRIGGEGFDRYNIAHMHTGAVVQTEFLQVLPRRNACALEVPLLRFVHFLFFHIAVRQLHRIVSVTFHRLLLRYRTGACRNHRNGNHISLFVKNLRHADFLTDHSLFHRFLLMVIG